MTRCMLVLLLTFAIGPLAGCYYTVKEPDGSTRRISRKEYNQLTKENDTAAHIGVPSMLD